MLFITELILFAFIMIVEQSTRGIVAILSNIKTNSFNFPLKFILVYISSFIFQASTQSWLQPSHSSAVLASI